MAALLRGKGGVSQLLLCLLPKQSTWHQHAARQAIWLRLLLDDLQLGLGNKPFPHHERQRWYPLRSPKIRSITNGPNTLGHHFLRERVEDNTISLSHFPSADNIADLLTKGLYLRGET